MNDSIYENYSVWKRLINSLNQQGVARTVRGGLSYLYRQVLYVSYPVYHKIFLDKKRQFIYKNYRYNYCLEKYNLSWRNERTLEIPIIQQLIKDNLELNILEIGCVLKHYKSSPINDWTIIDKYEQFDNVINEDIVKYKPEKKFDLIVSVSTIEHIGIDDGTTNPGKAIYAINHVVDNFLNKNGRFAFTIPIGYNKRLDQCIFNNEISISEKYYFLRISKSEWKEVAESRILDAIYGSPFIGANALFVGLIIKQ